MILVEEFLVSALSSVVDGCEVDGSPLSFALSSELGSLSCLPFFFGDVVFLCKMGGTESLDPKRSGAVSFLPFDAEAAGAPAPKMLLINDMVIRGMVSSRLMILRCVISG